MERNTNMLLNKCTFLILEKVTKCFLTECKKLQGDYDQCDRSLEGQEDLIQPKSLNVDMTTVWTMIRYINKCSSRLRSKLSREQIKRGRNEERAKYQRGIQIRVLVIGSQDDKMYHMERNNTAINNLLIL